MSQRLRQQKTEKGQSGRVPDWPFFALGWSISGKEQPIPEKAERFLQRESQNPGRTVSGALCFFAASMTARMNGSISSNLQHLSDPPGADRSVGLE